MNIFANDSFSVKAFDRCCNGCILNEKDIMISLIEQDYDKDMGYTFIDVFISQEQARFLHKTLGQAIFNNDYNKNKEFLNSLNEES